MSRKYYGVENLALSASQKSDLITALRQLGADNNAANPCNRNHWRARLDNDAVIFEANWNTADWEIDNVKSYLGNVFGIDPATIDHTTNQIAYGLLVTFSRSATNYMRVIAFGGVNATYAESHSAVLAYLTANSAAWGAA